MSFILDALERSRQERDADDARLAAAACLAKQQAPRSPWVPVLLLGLGLALAVIAWLLLSRPDAVDGSRGQNAVATPPAAARLTPPVPLPVPSAPRSAPPSSAEIPAASNADAAGDAVRDLYRDARASPAPDKEDELPGEASDDAAADDEAVAETQAEADIDALVARAEAALDSRELAAHPAPMLEELSQAFRDGVPTLMYSQHDYRSSGESAVFINRERRREGESVDGVSVREILPDSVILSYRGTVFRLKALNSWVNL
ncbi:general secretion pathway protein GspB [Chromatocurvus halotolerans]|uniref:Type II secretion system (T2SS) protein B n=1 Tax=Chromatocurvus halotolerans TaxID=1132028 RepID=A0A4R2LGH7_9GAMM|nr:general secretion pathway protein GspB [Chromatocurvus halotolerans]TCO78415.1 type II secretion system (T2SS) protein B [Chromatocurvus halotolerans]